MRAKTPPGLTRAFVSPLLCLKTLLVMLAENPTPFMRWLILTVISGPCCAWFPAQVSCANHTFRMQHSTDTILKSYEYVGVKVYVTSGFSQGVGIPVSFA